MIGSPYRGLPVYLWEDKTKELIDKHPIPAEIIVKSVIESWNMIHGSVIGDSLIIGETYFPTPQILGDFLHELIPIQISKYYREFRKGEGRFEKDLHCVIDDTFSIEIKTSSQKDIYGNRSYAQKNSRSGKSKSGYYLAINFPPVHKLEKWMPISQIRFGWLDEDDWRGQTASTGQQASLTRDVLEHKLITLYQNR